jgi:type I restriction enzyme S subunit
LDSLCSHTFSGGTPPTVNDAYYGGDIPWLRTQEVIFGRIFDTEIKITEAGLKNSSAKWVPEKSVIVAMYGNSAGRSAINEIPLTTNQACCNLVIDPDKADYRYVFYALLRSYEALKGLSRGAAQNNLNAAQVKAFTIPAPSVQVQRNIGEILSAYDDLIENNRRRMALLEKSARLLYSEWFVRLRFPGYEHTRVIGGVPDGWERKTLGDVAHINQTNLGSTCDGEIEYIDIASVTPGAINETTPYQFRDAPSRARRVVNHGDIIWSCVRPNRRSHAVIWQPPENLVASTGFAVITPISLPTSFLYQAVTTDLFVGYLENHAKGAAYPAVVAGDFERAKILVPSPVLSNAFNEFAEPLLSEAHNLRAQNQKLRAARDLLLPRLMSGELLA